MLQVTVNSGETRVSFDPGSKLNIAKAGEAKNEFARIVKGELLSLLRLCKEHKWTLSLVNPQQAVKDLFNLLQLQSIFKFQ